LFITFDVDFPDTLTDVQKDGIRKIFGKTVHSEL